MTNGHRNARQTDRSFPFNLNAMSIIAFCRAIDSGDAPAAELDMFSRWIKLTDDLLDAHCKPRKKAANRGRSKSGIAFLPSPA
jgi:hypothetical protein